MIKNQTRNVEVTFFSSLKRPLTYRVDADLPDRELLGRRVIAPFGSRKQVGIVTGVDTEYQGETKGISEFPDISSVMTEIELKFCRFIAEYYVCSLSEAIKAFLPQPLTARLKQTIRILKREELEDKAAEGDITAGVIIDAVGRRESLAAEALSGVKRNKLVELESEGLLAFDWDVREGKRRDEEFSLNAVKNAVPPKRLGEKSKMILDYLVEKGSVESQVLCHEFKVSRAYLKQLVEKGLAQINPTLETADEIAPLSKGEFVLNGDQVNAVSVLKEAIEKEEYAPFLLHGVTGSGKTEVYIEAIKRTAAGERSVIVIVPEIGLAQAMYYRLDEAFRGRVALIHSRLSARSRFEIWQRSRTGEVKIVIGPRSAIFMPLLKLGLIVVDEEHDQSLKQSSPAPRYHGRDLAVYRAQLEKCVVILGSATPSIESYHNAKLGKYRLLELPARVDAREMPQVQAIDMKQAIRKKGFDYLTDRLVKRVTEILALGGQVMLLLNRRGFSPSVHCYECGNKLTCKNCAVALVYHKARHRLICHICGYNEAYPESCPKCRSSLFLYKGIGTEKLEEELRLHFYGSNIIRMDLDSTRKKGSFHDLFHLFKSGRAQILVGTQMIAKGFDFPNVALVGIVSADTALDVPDFRARERTFQLLTQASGRAGRLNFPGEVLMQTLHPDDQTIALASKHDFPTFYAREIDDRRSLDFPPFTHLILLEVQSIDQEVAEKKSGELRSGLMNLTNRSFRLLGPVAAPIFKRKTLFRFHILLKTKRVKATLSQIDTVLQCKEFQTSNRLHIIVDVDPVDMM